MTRRSCLRYSIILSPRWRSLPIKPMTVRRSGRAIRDDGAVPVIPVRITAKRQQRYDRRLYRRRNIVERFFCRLKDMRRLATRFDKLARNFLATIYLFAARFWVSYRVHTLGARGRDRFRQRRRLALAHQFDMTEPRPAERLTVRHVARQRLRQRREYARAFAFALHADEADDHRSGEIAQPDLPRHRARRFEVDRGRRPRRAAVDVDRDAERRRLDQQKSAAGKRQTGRERLLDRIRDARRFIECFVRRNETGDECGMANVQPVA